MDRINKKLESLENIDRSAIYTKEEKKNDSFLDLYERSKALNSPLKNEREFEPHHRSSSTKIMTNNWHINNNRKDEKDLQTLKATNRKVIEETDPIKERVTHIEDKRKDPIKETSTIESVRDIINGDIKKEKMSSLKQDIERQKSLIETSKEDNGEKLCGKIETNDEVGKVVRKDMHKPKENSTLEESLRRKLEVEEKIEQEREIVNKGRKTNNNDSLKEKVNSDSVVRVKVEVVNKEDKKWNSLREKN